MLTVIDGTVYVQAEPVLTHDVQTAAADSLAELNRLGQEGWDAVAASPTSQAFRRPSGAIAPIEVRGFEILLKRSLED